MILRYMLGLRGNALIGDAAGYIDAYTERVDRDAIRERFHAGEVKVV